MSQYKDVFTDTVILAATTGDGIVVHSDGTIAAAGEGGYGVTLQSGNAGDAVPVIVLGTAVAVAGAAVNAKDHLTTDANGKVVPAANVSISVPAGATPVTSDAAQPNLVEAGGVLPEKLIGLAKEAAAAADEKIEILVIHT